VSYLLPLAAPALYIAIAIAAFMGPSFRPRRTIIMAEGGAIVAFAAAVGATLLLIFQGQGSAGVLGVAELGVASRTDVVSMIMLLLVSGIGWVVVRYSSTYLYGEARQGPFTGWISLTLAAVLLLVQAGSLILFIAAWIGTSVFLNKLLLFYPERVQAQRAAHKKWVTARFGDAALIGASILLVIAYGTADIGAILAAAKGGEAPTSALWASGLLAIAALLKSAQFPMHGWLTEVMEAPTPVSALLHAGLVNAGGFLLIRFADVMLASPGVLASVAMVGGFTALFGGLVMLTQPAVKTSLAWSTIAQMGFMMLQCGLTLFPIALLHIVAHSFYKAHAFLSSGGAVDVVAAIKRPGPIAVPRLGTVARAFGIAMAIYVLFALGFSFNGKSVQAFALGAILIFGVAYLLAQGLADTAPRALTRKTAVYSLAATVGYFVLQTGAEWLTAGTLPATPASSGLEWALIVLLVMSFGAVAFAQATFPLWAGHPAAGAIRVHLSNGLYVNAVFDRVLGGWSIRKATSDI